MDEPDLSAYRQSAALAEEPDTRHLFTLDLLGFRTYRWKTRREFKIYPPT